MRYRTGKFHLFNTLVVSLIVLRSSTTASALSALDEKINDIAKEANLRKNRQIEYENQLQTILKDILDRKEKQNSASRRTVFGDRDNIPMDIDEPPLESAKGKNRKCVVSLYLDVCSNLPSSQDATRSKFQGQEEKQTIIKSSAACIIPLPHIVKYENENLSNQPPIGIYNRMVNPDTDSKPALMNHVHPTDTHSVNSKALQNQVRRTLYDSDIVEEKDQSGKYFRFAVEDRIIY